MLVDWASRRPLARPEAQHHNLRERYLVCEATSMPNEFFVINGAWFYVAT
jgi:hypothetical protein